MNKKLVLASVFVLLLVAIGYTAFTGFFSFNGSQTVTTISPTAIGDRAVVARVIDGDTFELTDGMRVRLIGIDTTEKGEKCYKEGKDRLKELVEGKDVILEKDLTDKDRYGRLLRYVYVNDTFVNLLLAREGLAKMYTIKPDVKYQKQIEEAFLLARNENGCIWKSS
jgi:micrococcal nuclease